MAKLKIKHQSFLLDSWSGSRKKKCQTEVILLSNHEGEDEVESCFQLMAVLLAAGTMAHVLKEH